MCVLPLIRRDESLWLCLKVSLTSTFVDGWLKSSGDVTYCAGTGDPRNASKATVSLCEILGYTAGIGNLLFFIYSVPVLTGLTFPVVLMTLQLPFRKYLGALVIPFVGMAIQVAIISYELNLTTTLANDRMRSVGGRVVAEPMYPLELAFFVLIVYSSCVASTLSNERYNRSLFQIQRVLNEKRDALVTKRDLTPYVE